MAPNLGPSKTSVSAAGTAKETTSVPHANASPRCKPSNLRGFLNCDHWCTRGKARPLLTNTKYIEFDTETNTYKRPSVCLDCSIQLFQNRQKSLIDVRATTLEQEIEELVNRATKMSNDKDRNEILLTGKRGIVEDFRAKCDGECLLLWHEFANIWSNAEDFLANPSYSLRIEVHSDASGISVYAGRKNNTSQRSVGRDEISDNKNLMARVLKDKGL